MVQDAVLLVVPGVTVTVLLQVEGVPPAVGTSVNVTVPPCGTASPLTPVMVATKVTAIPKFEGLVLPLCALTTTVGVACFTVNACPAVELAVMKLGSVPAV
jgi:hypothetical protein